MAVRVLLSMRWWMIAGFLCAQGALVAQDRLIFQRFGMVDGLSQNTVNCIAQDRKGFLWIGSSAGLDKYDGHGFRAYAHDPSNPNSLSNNYVASMIVDRAGMLWIGTRNGGLNRFDPDRETWRRYRSDPDRAGLSSNVVQALAEDEQGRVWIGSDKGLDCLDPQTGAWIQYRHDPDDSASLPGDNILALADAGEIIWVGSDAGLAQLDKRTGVAIRYPVGADDARALKAAATPAVWVDRQGVLWSVTGDSLHRLDEDGRFTRYAFRGAALKTLFQDRDDIFWVGSARGLYTFDPNTGNQRRYTKDDGDPRSLGGDNILAVFEDRGGVLWVGSATGGLSKHNNVHAKFKAFQHRGDDPNSLSGDKVFSFLEDSTKAFWVGAHNGLNRMDGETFTRYLSDEAEPNSLGRGSVWCLFEDSRGRVWAGTDDGLSLYRRDTDDFARFKSVEDDSTTLSHGRVFDLAEGSDGFLWVGTLNGLNRFDPETGACQRFSAGEQPGDLSDETIWSLQFDRRGALWIGTQSGGVNRLDPGAGQFVHFRADPNDPKSLSGDRVLALCEDSRGVVWLGTEGGLSAYLSDGQGFESYRKEDGLSSDLIYAMVEDSQGNLWLGTGKGLSRFDPKLREFFNYTMKDGLLDDEFNLGAAYRADSNKLYFGTLKGFHVFSPEGLGSNQHRPPVHFTELAVLRGGDRPPERRSLLDERPGDTIELSYRDEVVSVAFAALDFVSPAQNQYAYKLEGLHDDWISTQDPNATFINLPAGHYTLRVKAANNDGLWNEEGDQLALWITPAPWRTIWAYLLYALIVAGMVLAYLHAQKRKLAQERWVNERLRRFDRLKDEFLANTSHELRTPLNGMIGLVESLIDGVAGKLQPRAVENLSMVLSSGKRLASLVNDILDFSKLKNHSLELRRRAVDMHALTDVVLTLSQPLVGHKDVKLINAVRRNGPPVSGDENRLQQIMHNLVGNAIKFTDKGEVVVSAETRGNALMITVSDTGVGIPRAHFESIFQSFEQVDGSDERSQSGTGLGLAITKQLVELHHGEIWVESQVNKGSKFTFTAPLASDGQEVVQLTGENALLNKISHIAFTDPAPVARGAAVKAIAEQGVFSVLIVDDEQVNLQVLVNHLSMRNYNLTLAASGAEALSLLEGPRRFDLVLLDIMMPRVTGYEVCEKIRKRFPVHELPVIFLTAKDQVADLVRGFELGANDYLVKPISKEELLLRVETHLALLDVNQHLEQKVDERTRELRVKNKELENIDRIVQAINREIGLENLLEALLKQGLILFPNAEKGAIFIWDDKANLFKVSATTGHDWKQLQNVTYDYGELIDRFTRDAQELAKGVFLIRESEDVQPRPCVEGGPAPKCMLAMAVMLQESFVGFLELDSYSRADDFEDSDIDRLARFREHAVSAIAKARTLKELQEKNEEIMRTQKQMLMQEKMASLGTLTAGVAHEIKNPLNFVNNFSELCMGLTRDLKQTLADVKFKLNEEEQERLDELIVDLEENANLINVHGNRANNIVQSMMMLSQGQSAERQKVDLNMLLEKYANLAYHGRLLKRDAANVALCKDLDPAVGEIEVAPPNLGRVIINLVNNAYDTVVEKHKLLGEGFSPEITLRSRNLGYGAEICVRDNGMGVSRENQEKIFNPFFTTKPTGRGNIGLGLSICFDIVVQEHGGEIKINTQEGDFTEFVLFLPNSPSLVADKSKAALGS